MKKSSIIVFLLIGLAVTVNAQAQDQEELWDIGAGLRLNYLRLTGGITGYSAKDDSTFNIDYKDIGMSNYAPSVALALAGKYKKGNYTAVASLGYRLLRMNSRASQDDGSWFEEDDHYAGPFISVVAKYTKFAK